MGYIKIHKKNLFHNFDYFAKKCHGVEKLCVALKDNAYGHGIEQIAKIAFEYGIKHVFVRSLEEANVAKKYHFETILILYDIPKKVEKNYIVAINSLEHIVKIPQKTVVELKIDTGMNRNGIKKDQIADALDLIRKQDLMLCGVFTHFCCAEEDNTLLKEQEELFLEAVSFIKSFVKTPLRIHCANSAATHKVDMNRYDIARVGLGIYGYLDLQEESYLQPVLSLYAQKITTKNIKKGDHIGYGSESFVAKKDMVVSNYDIGYGDGLFRANSHKKRKIANGKEILGRVSMDSFSVESDKSEVCVFENANHLAQLHNTITYEILTSLKPNIKRIVV